MPIYIPLIRSEGSEGSEGLSISNQWVSEWQSSELEMLAHLKTLGAVSLKVWETHRMRMYFIEPKIPGEHFKIYSNLKQDWGIYTHARRFLVSSHLLLTIFLITKSYILSWLFIAKHFEEPWKWVFRIRLNCKIGFRINSGNAQFPT